MADQAWATNQAVWGDPKAAAENLAVWGDPKAAAENLAVWGGLKAAQKGLLQTAADRTDPGQAGDLPRAAEHQKGQEKGRRINNADG